MTAAEIERATDHPPATSSSVARSPRQPLDIIALCDDYWRLAQRISATEFVPKALQRRPEAVLAALLSGAERGLGPMESLRSINVIEGRPNLSAEAMRALVFAAGHHIEIVETNERRCSVIGRRAGSEHTSPPFVWTLDRARRAKLLTKDNWQKYSEAMLLARATSDLCKALFPDVIAGLEVTELVQDDLAPEPETATTTRRRRGLPQPAATTRPVEPVRPSDGHQGTDPAATTAPEARSYRHDMLEAELTGTEAAIEAEVVEVVEVVEDQADADDDDESTPWATPPDQVPAADPGLGRRIHATLAEATPDMAAADRDVIRHALVAVITRKRPTGPVLSSADLDYDEQLALSQLIDELRGGRMSIVQASDGLLDMRYHGWRYDITLDPPAVTVTRVQAADDDPAALAAIEISDQLDLESDG